MQYEKLSTFGLNWVCTVQRLWMGYIPINHYYCFILHRNKQEILIFIVDLLIITDKICLHYKTAKLELNLLSIKLRNSLWFVIIWLVFHFQTYKPSSKFLVIKNFFCWSEGTMSTMSRKVAFCCVRKYRHGPPFSTIPFLWWRHQIHQPFFLHF